MNQYQKTTEKKKQAIIQAALHLFKEKGFKETSIKSIAEVAEVSPVSIYNYFGGKDNLVALCVNDLFEEVTQQAEDILNSNPLILGTLNFLEPWESEEAVLSLIDDYGALD